MKKIIIPILLFALFFLGCSNPTSSGDNPTSEIKNVTVSYDSRGGSTVSSQEVQSGGTVGTLPVSEKFSYHFGGWYTALNENGTEFLADTVVKEDMTVYAYWAQTAEVATLAGSGSAGSSNGTGIAASFSSPTGVAVDSAGNVYVGDTNNNSIRKISPKGVVTILVGTAASISSPTGVAVDKAGNVYVADTNNHVIRKITTSFGVTILAGSGLVGSNDGTNASFSSPSGVAVDSAGNVYVADTDNHLIRKITTSGVVTTLAGSRDTSGKDNGTGTAASFNTPKGVAVDGAGNVYVADTNNHLIRKVNPAGVVTTLAGSGDQGWIDGTGTAASFSSPTGVAVDSAGNVYVGDGNNHSIRKISPEGVVTTLAGSGADGSKNGSGTEASFYWPKGVAVDSAGAVYVADSSNHLIRKITQ